MGDRDRELFFIGQRMPRLLPELVAHTEAFSPISCDQQLVSRRIELFAAVLPRRDVCPFNRVKLKRS